LILEEIERQQSFYIETLPRIGFRRETAPNEYAPKPGY
jgi:DNA-binding winged helix-turn-helix (wHTH) protein